MLYGRYVDDRVCSEKYNTCESALHHRWHVCIGYFSFLGEQSGDSIAYTFTGKVTGDEMGGALDMGEYLSGKWSARRRAARRG